MKRVSVSSPSIVQPGFQTTEASTEGKGSSTVEKSDLPDTFSSPNGAGLKEAAGLESRLLPNAVVPPHTQSAEQVLDAIPASKPKAPATPQEAEKLKRQGASWTDAEVRTHYLRTIEVIPRLNEQWIVEGRSPEWRAREACEIRHTARLTCRAMMTDQDYVRNELQPRDIQKYGNPDGPTFEFLVEKNRKNGMSDEANFENIIGSSKRSDPVYNAKFGLVVK